MNATNQSVISINDSDTGLIWSNPLGYGVNNTPPIDYSLDYWDEYVKRDNTEMGKALTNARTQIVNRHTRSKPVDIGIGAGAFVTALDCFGYDINPIAVQWLKERGKYIDVYQSFVGCLTFWDSLEHIPDPSILLRRVPKGGKVFVSIPVFESKEHCLASRHYKPGEHIWYFTHQGFLDYMTTLGYINDEYSNIETVLGRDGITMYAFTKKM